MIFSSYCVVNHPYFTYSTATTCSNWPNCTPLKGAYLKGISKGAEPKLQAPDNNAIRFPAVVPQHNGNLTHVIGLISLLRDTNWPVNLSGWQLKLNELKLTSPLCPKFLSNIEKCSIQWEWYWLVHSNPFLFCQWWGIVYLDCHFGSSCWL